jgi:hypothetical protein
LENGQHEDAQEVGPAQQDLCKLRAAIPVAEEMGKGLGQRPLLL